MKLLDLLRQVGKKPGFYIGDFPRRRVTIWNLRAFLVGYQCGTRQPGLEGDDVLDAFTFWVCTRFGVPDGSMDWSGHIWRHCGEDDEAAFRLFFELLEEYLRDLELHGADTIKNRFMEMMQKR
jgi:hypothetical protein